MQLSEPITLRMVLRLPFGFDTDSINYWQTLGTKSNEENSLSTNSLSPLRLVDELLRRGTFLLWRD